jgi:hypothetical protein
MAIGTIGAIALGASALGGVASAVSTGNASRAAVNASQQATAENNALARDIYGQNRATLAPFVQQGTAATSYINQLLGIAPQAQPQPQMMGMGGGGQFAFNPRDDFMSGFGGSMVPGMGGGGFTPGIAPPGVGGNMPAPGAAQAGFDAFRNSTGYDFRLNEGSRAITNSQAARGMLNSGATLKGLTRFGQNIASDEFNNYLNSLLGQQSLGANAASAQAGVANNFSSQVQANNAQNATNVGNAALARAGNNNQFLTGLLSAGATVLGGRS